MLWMVTLSQFRGRKKFEYFTEREGGTSNVFNSVVTHSIREFIEWYYPLEGYMGSKAVIQWFSGKIEITNPAFMIELTINVLN